MFQPYWFICFAIISNVIGYSKSAEFDDCPIGSEFNDVSSTKCFTLSRVDYNFTGALEYCKSIGGKVVDPLSYGELDRLWVAINDTYGWGNNKQQFLINYHDMDLQVSMIFYPTKHNASWYSVWNSTVSNNTFAMRSLTTLDPLPNFWWNSPFIYGDRRPGYHCAAYGYNGVEDYICADSSPTVYRSWAVCEKPRIDSLHEYLDYKNEPVYQSN